jgi:transcriptional regulator with XRE-family HTH domain
LLIDKGISQADMRKAAGIESNTLAKTEKNEDISLRVLGKYAKFLIVILRIWSSI